MRGEESAWYDEDDIVWGSIDYEAETERAQANLRELDASQARKRPSGWCCAPYTQCTCGMDDVDDEEDGSAVSEPASCRGEPSRKRAKDLGGTELCFEDGEDWEDSRFGETCDLCDAHGALKETDEFGQHLCNQCWENHNYGDKD